MDPITLIILLLLGAAVLVAAEMVLPTHGLLGVGAATAACGAVVIGFGAHRWLGLGLFIGLVIAAPLITSVLLKVWERSPVGKRVMLTATTPPIEHERILPGDIGQTISELRPMGEAEFGPVAVQVIAHQGTIPPGTRVRVLSYRDGVATVEVVERDVHAG